MRDEKIFHDYANFKLENDDLIKELTKNDSAVFIRVSHVLDVVDYYYDKLIDDPDFSDDEENIFTIGYAYLLEQIEQIKDLLSKVYNNKVIELDKHAKEVNLLLNTYDFQSEVVNNEFEIDEDVKKLMSFDEDIYNAIINKEEIPNSKFTELDRLTYRIFKKNNRDYYSINSIFIEIAD